MLRNNNCSCSCMHKTKILIYYVFRSLDKGFHTDNAITHVFEEAEPVRLPDTAEDHYVTINDETYTCSRYIYNKLQVLR